jgi:hypothetical protein
MKLDPVFCDHADIKKVVKLDTILIPELGIEQLVLRIRVYCKSCKENFIPKTMQSGFSTDEVGVVGEELFVPLEPPMVEDLDVSEGEQLTSDVPEEGPKGRLN